MAGGIWPEKGIYVGFIAKQKELEELVESIGSEDEDSMLYEFLSEPKTNIMRPVWNESDPDITEEWIVGTRETSNSIGAEKLVWLARVAQEMGESAPTDWLLLYSKLIDMSKERLWKRQIVKVTVW